MKYFYRRNRRLFLLLLVLAASFVLISRNLAGSPRAQTLSFPERVVYWVVSPIQRGVTAIMASVKLAWYDYIYLVKLKEKNELMQKRLAMLESKVNSLREDCAAAERLAGILGLATVSPYEFRVAKIIGYDPSGYYRTAMLDKGLDDGLGPDMAVVTDAGVVGRLIKLHPGYSQALLLVDFNSAIDAVVQRTREKGIVVGLGGDMCEMKYVDRQSDIRVGDTVVSSGASGIFPPGLVIGEVAEVEKVGSGLFQEVKVRPAARLDRLEEVAVIVRAKQ